MQDKKDFTPRSFYDYEKEEVGKTEYEIDAIIREIYRSAVHEEMPGQSKAEPKHGDTQVWHPADLKTAQQTTQWPVYTEPAEEIPQTWERTSRERARPGKKRRRRRWPMALACTLLLAVGLYGIAIYGNIPFIRKWRDIYIETAMGTMTHQWLATAIIEDEIIEEVMDTRTDVETSQEEIDTHWEAQPLKDADEKIKWKKLRKRFFELYSEIDPDSFEAYIEQYGDGCIDEEGYLVIDHAEIGEKETGIVTVHGDPVLAVDTKNGITIIKVTGSEYDSRLAIVKDPAQLDLALAEGFGTEGSTIGRIAADNNAVLAVNASGFYDPEGHGNGGIAHGLVIKDGQIYSEFAGGNNKTIGFDYENNLQIGIYRDGQNLRDAVEFKPALVFDGQKMVEGSAGWGISPRTAIGQTRNGQVLLLVVDGRQPGHSIGCTMGDLADVLLRYDAYQACNLDGGSSSIMYYNGRKITRPSAGDKESGRRLPNAFIITAR